MTLATNVLLVDDSVAVATSLRAVLMHANYRVEIAHSLNEMNNLLRKVTFDAAVVDLGLGAESGLDALAVLRTRQPTCQSLVLTGNPSIDSAVAALRLGAVDFLTKPCDLEQLKEALLAAKMRADAARACLECSNNLPQGKTLRVRTTTDPRLSSPTKSSGSRSAAA